MSFELTPEGLSTQTQEEIVDELAAKLRSTFGNNLNTTVESIMGQLVNIVSEFRALDQQVLQDVWAAFDPNVAVGVALDRLAALTGSVREGESFSVVHGLLTFSGPGTSGVGDLINNDDNQTVWAQTSGPHTAVGPYPEEIEATFTAQIAGPTLGQANTNWSLITGPANLTSFTNPTDDANLGALQEDDPSFRVNRQVELYGQNVGGLAAIRAVVSKVPGVTSVRVYHNPNVPGGIDGIPFKAFNVVVETNPSPPPTSLQQLICEAIFRALGAGGEAFGTDHTRTVVDDEGLPHEVSFDVVDEVNVYVAIGLLTGGTEQAISPNLDTVVEAAILEFALANFDGIGQNQLGFEYSAIVSKLQESGQISGVTSVTVDLSRVALGGPFFDPLEIDIRERPQFNSGDIKATVAL